MFSAPVIEGLDIVEDGKLSLGFCIEDEALGEALSLESGEEGFTPRVIITITGRAHAGQEIAGGELVDKRFASVLTASIRMEEPVGSYHWVTPGSLQSARD